MNNSRSIKIELTPAMLVFLFDEEIKNEPIEKIPSGKQEEHDTRIREQEK